LRQSLREKRIEKLKKTVDDLTKSSKIRRLETITPRRKRIEKPESETKCLTVKDKMVHN